MNARFVASFAVALCAAAAASASAQTPAPTATPVAVPTLPPQQQLDPYTRAAVQILTGVVNRTLDNLQNSAVGNVSYFKRFEMQIQTGPNAYQTVHLHQGTVINPTGRSIQPGQRVQVSGVRQADGSLAANVITIDN